MSHSCIILLHCIDCVPSLLPVLFPLGRCCSDDVVDDTDEDTMLSSEVPGKKNPLVHSDTIALALFYRIRTTMCQLLHAVVVEPLSSARPVFATVNS